MLLHIIYKCINYFHQMHFAIVKAPAKLVYLINEVSGLMPYWILNLTQELIHAMQADDQETL